MKATAESGRAHRLRVTIRGAVQGVGFRPFVYRLATKLKLAGWVVNGAQGVFIEVDGADGDLREFLLRLESERPPRAFIQSFESTWLDAAGYEAFEIRESESRGAVTALVLPDIALCDECRAEILDPSNRRHRYPFTNCTNCGPRYSIIEALPYDRASTTMRGFSMCPACSAEYRDPLDRRFHAQPNACPICGPHVELWRGDGSVVAARDAALRMAADAIVDGAIVAVKGLGGFHLIVDAASADAVARLRERKRREEKPLAIMVESVEDAESLCVVTELERHLLRSPEAPIVLLECRRGAHIAASVAPATTTLGVMLAYTPLHVLLLREIGRPVVATSGNRSEEPICTDEREALERLGPIADLLLVHDRPIARHVDDSVVRIMAERPMVLRRARGYAPLPVAIEGADAVLAVGAHQKSAVALAVGGNAFISQHIGDLASEPAHVAFREVIASLEKLYETKPSIVACDLHPDYLSTRQAHELGLPIVAVQHHHAHVLSCMAENEIDGPVLGIAWDGTGLGTDGTVWGGEFLYVGDRPSTGESPFERVAHLRTFRLPGGDAAAREPRRAAIGVLHELYGAGLLAHGDLAPIVASSPGERSVMLSMLERGINSPVTSSAGRLFDAIASIAGLRQVTRHEGQAAMELEHALAGLRIDESYPMRVCTGNPLVVDWEPMIKTAIDDVRTGVEAGVIAARAHNGFVESMVEVAVRVGCERVVLTGGCFQNRYLTERAIARLREEGLTPYWHQRMPPNDGGIALGQIAAAARSGHRKSMLS